MLKTGTQAPDFTLPNQRNEPIKLSALLERGPVVLYFYPQDETPGCKREACAFRDQYEDFKTAGAEVVGVSADSPEDHAAFAQNHRLPFQLLSDPDKAVHKLYEVPKTLFLFPGRVTYVIARNGELLHTFNSMWKPEKHVTEAITILRKH